MKASLIALILAVNYYYLLLLLNIKFIWRFTTMSNKTLKTSLILAAGSALTIGLSTISVANAAENPFSMTALSSGYMVVASADGKCGSAKCGGNKKAGEAKCGGDKAGDAKWGGDKDGEEK
jgi:uncharacterized low-complexity protein